MNNTKKIVILCLVPAILTIFFIVGFTVPAVNQYFKLSKQIEQKKLAIKNTKATVEMLKANKNLAKELERINTQLIGFDVEFPTEFRDEILLIDLEIFASEAVNRIVGLQSFSEREMEIIDPKETPEERKKKKLKKDPEMPPVQIIEKPFDINTVAYYSELIDFVDFLETYQRKVNIDSISAKIFNDDNQNPNPRIALTIKASTYKSIANNARENKDEQSKK